MASEAMEERLDALNDALQGLGRTSHRHPLDYGKAVEAFIDLVDLGEVVDPDAVRAWARGRGWTEDAARDLAGVADAVEHTMRSLRSRGRL